MRQTQLIVRLLSAFGVATLLAACAASGSSGGSAIPSETDAKKGPGNFGVAIADDLVVPAASGKHTCTGPYSYCYTFVPKHIVKDSLTLSSSSGSASLNATVALGSLTGSGKAASVVGPSSVSAINVGWEDTFTITSKTLPPNTPVSFTATLTVKGKAVTCSATVYRSVSISTAYSGLSFTQKCGSSPTPVLTATVNTTVGASFTESANLSSYLQTGNFSFGGKGSIGPFKAGYHLDPITSGASYITASGKSYL